MHDRADMRLFTSMCRQEAWERENKVHMPASVFAAAGVSEVTPEQAANEAAWESSDSLCWRHPHEHSHDRC